MGEIKVRVQAAHASRQLLRGATAVRDEMGQAVKDVADDAELIHASHALVRSGRMARGVVAQARGLSATVRVTARDPESGFDYVPVTRFGHRTARIVPKHGRALKMNVGGQTIFRASSRGFHPKSDWGVKGNPQIERRAAGHAAKAARRIEQRI